MRKTFVFIAISIVCFINQPTMAKRYIKDDEKKVDESSSKQKEKAAVKSQKEWQWKDTIKTERIQDKIQKQRQTRQSEFQGRLSDRKKRIEEKANARRNRIERRKGDRYRKGRGSTEASRYKDGETKWKGGGVIHTPDGPMNVEEDKEKTDKKENQDNQDD